MHITNAESLYILRRRLQLSQSARAEELDLKEWYYIEMETGKMDIPEKLRFKDSLEINTVEQCILLRRRQAMTQSELAVKLNVSRLWVNRMEQGLASPAKLIEYWN